MPFKTFTNGEVLNASDVNTYLARQAVPQVTEAQRAAILVPEKGMLAWNLDADRLEVYTGTRWRAHAPSVVMFDGVQSSGVQSVGANVWTKMMFSGRNMRGNIAADAATDVTIKSDGLYLVSAQAVFNAATKGTRAVRIQRNGVTLLATPESTAELVTLQVSRPVSLADGDVINAWAISTVAVALGAGGEAYNNALTVIKIGN